MRFDPRNLKLIEKGLILISVPLIFGLIVLLLLTDQLTAAELAIKQGGSSQHTLNSIERIKTMLLIAGGVELCLSVSLIYFFMKTVSRRLLITMDNALRMANREPLKPMLEGTDEIGTLDRVVHDVAQALEDAALRERAVIEHAADVICSIDKNHKFISVSPASIRIFGYAPEELVDRSLTVLLLPEDVRPMLDWANSVATADGDLQFESPIRSKDGRIASILWSASWSHQEHAIFCVAHDITQRKVAEEKLRASEERVRRIIESMPVSLIIVNDNGYIELTNLTAESMFRYTYDEMVGERLDKLLTVNYDSFCQDIAPKAPGKSVEVVARKKDGTTFPVEISMNAISFSEGQRSLVTMIDVTERHEVERLKREFVAMVSHDLRTPLSSIQGVLALLSAGVIGSLNDRGVNLVFTAEEEIGRLMSLINDLLDLERMEAGKFDLKLEPVDLADVIAPSVKAVSSLAERKRINIVSPQLDVIVTADGARLTQVLINLLTNAVKFSPTEGTIKLLVTEDNGWVEVSVQDEGRGIPQEHLDAVFDRFHQVESGDAREKGGTGLGLPICKMIVESHDGKIGVVSKPGEGSRFWFRIPR